jgi:hypothetical protein
VSREKKIEKTILVLRISSNILHCIFICSFFFFFLFL